MSDDKSDEFDLDKLFDAAKSKPVEPSTDFFARVLSDAEAMQPAAPGVIKTPVRHKNGISDFFQGLSEAIGGWPGFAGLATAAVTGLWIGISPPSGLIEPIGSVLGTDTSAFTDALEYGDGFDFTLFEG